MAQRNETNLVPDYPLQRGSLSSIRLYLQHWMWRRQLGYLLHPKIPIKEGTKIADVACGTGIWMLDAAREFPFAGFDGSDISSAQFPRKEWIPQNTTLSCLDILKPIPESVRGVYDVVHVGLVILVVENDNPLPLLDNILSLLKPGGFIQWDEADLGGVYVTSPNQQTSCSALDDLRRKSIELFSASKGGKFQWPTELNVSFHNHGLEVIAHKYFPIEDDIAVPWTLTHLLASVEMIKNLDQPPGSATEWWMLQQKAEEEVLRGASMRMGMVSTVGRKAPLS